MAESRFIDFADAMSRDLRLDREIAHRGLIALLPAVACGFRRTLLTEIPGSDELLSRLEQILEVDDALAVTTGAPVAIAKGNMVLGEIFGFRDLSRIVALNASRESGIERLLLQRMLPVVALLVARRLADAHREARKPRRQGLFARLLHSPDRPRPDAEDLLLKELILDQDDRWQWLDLIIERHDQIGSASH